MKANASSSSDTSPAEVDPFEVDLAAGGHFPPLPTAFLADRDRDLLEPLTFLAPGDLPGPEAPKERKPPAPKDRAALARALAEANRGYGVPRAEELAEKLADPETCVVVTGQQPGILGGPLLGLSKLLSAVRYAEALEAAGHKAVPIFWVATEDHDWDEVGRATLLGDEPETMTLGDDAEPLRPVGDRRLGDGIVPILERLGETARGLGYEERLAAVVAAHGADGSFIHAFCGTLVALLGERSPLFLDSQLPALKQAQAPHLRRLIEQRGELDAAYARADEEVTERGYPLQVTPQPGVSPLFLIRDGERRRIEWRGDDRYGLRGLDDFEAPVADLLALLDEDPSRVSPGVLARPGIQDAVLGTTLQLMGPSELSYMTQARAAYPILGIEGVHTTLRPHLMAVDPKQEEWLGELELPLTELFEESVESIVADRFGQDFITPIRDRLQATLDELEGPVLAVDKTLKKPLQKTRDQIDRGLDNFIARVEAAVARNHETWTRRVTQIQHALVPDGELQERSLSVAWLWVRHGDDLVDALYHAVRLDSRNLGVARWSHS